MLERSSSDALLRRYVYGSDLVSMTTGAGAFYEHEDGLGSVQNVTNASGAKQWTYVYEPVGLKRTETKNSNKAPVSPIQFTGEYLDATPGFYHLRARQHDPALGRFSAIDPAAPPLADPYVAAYLYANGRPTVLVDPSGEFGVFGAVVGGVVGGIAGGTQAALTGEGWKGIIVGAGTGAVTGAAVGAAPVGLLGGALLAGTADLVAQTGTQYWKYGSVRGCEFNVGSVVGSIAGGGVAAGLGSLVAREASSLGARTSQVVAASAAFDPGLHLSVGGNLAGQGLAGGCESSSPSK